MRARIEEQAAKGTSRRLAIGAAVIVVVMIAIAGTVLADTGGWFGNDNPWPYDSATGSPVLAAVGDISCQPDANQGTNESASQLCGQGSGSTVRNAAQNATAQQVEQMKPSLVAVLGDLQYQNGYYSDFENSYDKYWGAFKFLQRPAPGNHEFYDNKNQAGVRGLGYFDYFNGIQHNASDGSEVETTVTTSSGNATQPAPQPDGQAGEFGQTGNGWYSYNLGAWHLISLNVECADEPDGCDPNGRWFASETQWLAHDLSLDHNQCTLAYWHQPTFSSTASSLTSDSAEGQAADAWWKLLYAHGADVVLNGHDHVYTRFAPMDPAGNADPKNGIREFIVGTGGESLDTLNPAAPNVQASTDRYYGVMKLTLGHNGYKWDYESAMKNPSAPPGTATYSDTGSGRCHGPSQS